MNRRLNKGYVIDNNAISHLVRFCPQNSQIYKNAWISIDKLIATRKLISPTEVRDELLAWRNPKITEWVKSKDMFVTLNEQQLSIAKGILKKHRIVKWQRKTPPLDADVFVIALAIAKGNWTVVSNETIKGSKETIPYVCDKLGIKCLLHWKFLEELGLRTQPISSSS